MRVRQIIEYVFFAVISGIGTLGVAYVQKISDTMNTLTKNIIELNARMEIQSAETKFNNNRIEDHESRLRHIEFLDKK